jgi:cytoskeletal protein RodZ
LTSFGENLKRERELRHISLREISEATKINLRYLDALEKNEFRHLPGGVFNKGFIRAFAQYIGIDPEAMVESYLEELQRQEARTQEREKEKGRRTAVEPRRGAPTREAPGPRRAPWIAAAVVFVVIAVAAVIGASTLLHRRARARLASPAHADVTAKEAGASREAPASSPPAGGAAAEPRLEGIAAKIVVDRPVRGSITCDGTLVHSLESLPQGAMLDVHCRETLVLDADDAGALRVGVDGAAPVRLGGDGTPLIGHRIVAASERAPGGGTP